MNDFLCSLLDKFQSPGGCEATVTFDDSVRRGIAMHLETMLLEAPRWLDAPTCEGWWWFHEGDEKTIVEVVQGDGLEFWDYENDHARFVRFTKGRWFGPLVPPS